MTVRKRNNEKSRCFLCHKPIKKGQWCYIHDNIYNKINPKIFCCKKCRIMFLFGVMSNTSMEFL